jgi:hypothetical protein
MTIVELTIERQSQLSSSVNDLNRKSSISPMDSAEQLQRIYLAGFELQAFERFPKAIGVVKGNCVALLTPTPTGLTTIGTPGWKMGEVFGVLTELQGRKVFQAKAKVVEATRERLEELQRFRDELKQLLAPVA